MAAAACLLPVPTLRQAEGQELIGRIVGSRSPRAAGNIEILSQRCRTEAMPAGGHEREPDPAIALQVEAFVLIVGPLVILSAEKNDHALEQRPGPASARGWNRRRRGPSIGRRIVDVVQTGHVFVGAK